MRYVFGNLIDFPTLAHGCNTKGVMGAGVALAVSRRFPETYRCYMIECLEGRYTPGMNLVTVEDGHTIHNLATQEFPGADAKTDLIERAIIRMALSEHTPAGSASPTEVAIPLIGCGLGGLSWWQVEPLFLQLEAAFPWIKIVVVVFPGDTSALDQVHEVQSRRGDPLLLPEPAQEA